MATHTLEFRTVQPSDLPLINQMMRAGKGYWGYPKEGLDRFMQSFGIQDPAYLKSILGYMAESEGKVIGYYLLKTDETPPMLDHFILNTQLIGQGYGRQLWKHCIAQCQKEGWTEFTFWSDPHAQGFYEHMGCTKIAERPMITMPGQVAPIMKFSIPS